MPRSAATSAPRSVSGPPAAHAAVYIPALSACLFSVFPVCAVGRAFSRSIMLARFPFSSLAQLFGCWALVGAQLGHERTVSTG